MIDPAGSSLTGVMEVHVDLHKQSQDKVEAHLASVRASVTKQLHTTQQLLAAHHEETLCMVEDAFAELSRQQEAALAQLSYDKNCLQAQLVHCEHTASVGELPVLLQSPKNADLQSGRRKVAWGKGELADAIGKVSEGHCAEQLAATLRIDVGEDKLTDQVQVLRCAAIEMLGSETEIAEIAASRPQSRESSNSQRRSTKEMLRKSVCASALEATLKDDKEDENEQRKAVFVDAHAMKEKVKMAVMRKQYSVMDFYHVDGLFQRIARSTMFENITLAVIAVNSIWISVDIDLNSKATLIGAHPVFVTAENAFCLYFVFELLVRFAAFDQKHNCLRDAWFVFDSALVVTMVLETWVMSIVILLTHQPDDTGIGNASILKLARLMRLTRMVRMIRLLRAIPELVILIKGMKVASRSVFFTLCLLVIIIYVFAVGLTQVTVGFEPMHSRYFDTVLASMNTLLLRGVLPDLADLVNTMSEANYAFGLVMLLFILMSSLTVMNMLVGVLVEVVKVVAAVEKEQMTMQYVKTMLLKLLNESGMDEDRNITISRHQFEQLLLKPKAARIIQDVGVDVVGLIDFLDFIFEDDKELSFPEFMDVILQMRSCNNATVKDVVDLRKYVQNQINGAVSCMTEKVVCLMDRIPIESRSCSANSRLESGRLMDGHTCTPRKQHTPSTLSGSRPSSTLSTEFPAGSAFPDCCLGGVKDDFDSQV